MVILPLSQFWLIYSKHCVEQAINLTILMDLCYHHAQLLPVSDRFTIYNHIGESYQYNYIQG